MRYLKQLVHEMIYLEASKLNMQLIKLLRNDYNYYQQNKKPKTFFLQLSTISKFNQLFNANLGSQPIIVIIIISLVRINSSIRFSITTLKKYAQQNKHFCHVVSSKYPFDSLNTKSVQTCPRYFPCSHFKHIILPVSKQHLMEYKFHQVF